MGQLAQNAGEADQPDVAPIGCGDPGFGHCLRGGKTPEIQAPEFGGAGPLCETAAPYPVDWSG
jgi:hypothetical protein